jgi:hypothetical protein
MQERKEAFMSNRQGERSDAYCDREYRGVGAEVGETTVHVTNKRKRSLSRSAWRWLRRRVAIEPVIGHLKMDTRLDRNYLLGEEGDRINAILSGCGFNVRKLLRAFFLFLLFWIDLDSKNPTQSRLTLLVYPWLSFIET